MNKTLFTILVIVGGLLTVILFSNNCRQPVKPVIVPVKEQAKQVAAAEQRINPKVDSLKAEIKRRDSSTTTLIKQKDWLQKENKRLANLALQKKPDTTNNSPLGDGGSKQAIINVVRNAEQADSICNLVIAELQTTILQQEDIIALKDSLYNQLKASFNFALDQQSALNSYSNQLQKQLKKKQVENFAWKGLTGAAILKIIYSIIKR